MHYFHNLRPLFVSTLGVYFAPPSFLDAEDGLNTHMYLGHLVFEMMTSKSAESDFAKRVTMLVTDLYENGDDLCRNLVYVSFFENLYHLTRRQVSSIRKLFSNKMARTMDEAIRELGYVW